MLNVDVTQGGPEMAHFLYALTSSNIDRVREPAMNDQASVSNRFPDHLQTGIHAKFFFSRFVVF